MTGNISTRPALCGRRSPNELDEPDRLYLTYINRDLVAARDTMWPWPCENVPIVRSRSATQRRTVRLAAGIARQLGW